MLVMRKKKLLAGTKVYINNDLTREQMYQEKQLRTKRRELLSQPSFEGTRIRIYKGKLWANGSPITGLESIPRAPLD